MNWPIWTELGNICEWQDPSLSNLGSLTENPRWSRVRLKLSPKHYWTIWFFRSKKYLISYPTLARIRSELFTESRSRLVGCLWLSSDLALVLEFKLDLSVTKFRVHNYIDQNIIGLCRKNDTKDSLAHDDKAHKAVQFTKSHFFCMKWVLLWLKKQSQGWSSWKRAKKLKQKFHPHNKMRKIIYNRNGQRHF